MLEHLKVSLTLVVVDIFISNCRFPGMYHVLGNCPEFFIYQVKSIVLFN